uniref:Uncharacterized protein n=1 Tax=Magallana gigas TaxID=29159 RepID=K1PVL4_MAGGI
MSRALSRNLTRASLKIPSFVGGRSSKTFFVDPPTKPQFDPDDDYDFDFESDEEESSPISYDSVEDVHRRAYKTFCKQLGVMPCSKVLRQFGKTSVNLADLNLSNKELKAALMTFINIFRDDDGDYSDEDSENDGEIYEINLSGNKLTTKEMEYVIDLLTVNKRVSNLVLSGCHLAGESLEKLADFLRKSNTIQKLDLSNNDLTDKDAEALCKIIQDNESIFELILAHNNLGEGGVAIGNALEKNDTLRSLDLSWNHIRVIGAVGLAKGVQNPITAPMTSIFLSRLLRAKHSGLQELDLAGIVVDKEFESVLEKIREKRLFTVRYDTSLPVNKGAAVEVDPKNMEGYPISQEAMDSVMSYLDTNKDGSVDLLEFIDGERKLKRKLIQEREEQKLRQSAEEELRGGHEYSQAYRRPANPKLPPIRK